MVDRVPSDHASVSTHRAEIERSGGTRRPCLRLPADVGLDDGDVVRLVLDGTERHERVDVDARGPLLRGAYDNRRLARTPGEGTNRLVEWLHATGRDPGQSVDVDVVEAGSLYGVRVPGERVVYEVTESPDSSLSDIAEKFGRE
jgi:hypothetical protein